jgi:segregation and condensation protein A
MKLSIISPHTSDYTVETRVYEGPLDLLLQLIERAELDITEVSLAQLTDQYLEHLNSISEVATEEVSAFLVIAAKLIQIKSEALLPRHSENEVEEDVGQELVRQLKLYKRFKEISKILRDYEDSGSRTYLRIAPTPNIESKIDVSEINLEDLLVAAQAVLLKSKPDAQLDNVITIPRITIRQKINLIAQFLKHSEQGTFQQLLSKEPTHEEIVVTFLAMLELVKRHLVQVWQESLFGGIEIKLASTWDEEQPLDLEFRE